MREKGFILPVILAVILIVIVTVGGMVLYIQNKNKLTLQVQQTIPTQTPVPTPTSTPQKTTLILPTALPFTSGDLTNWKVYTSEKFKISLKYPANFVRTFITYQDAEGLTIFSSEKEKQEFEDCAKPAGTEHCFAGSITIGFQEKNKSSDESLENWIKTNEGWSINQVILSPDNGGLTVIDNKKAFKVKSQGMTGQGYEIYIDKNTSVLQIYGLADPSGQLPTILDQILSSLKFLN